MMSTDNELAPGAVNAARELEQFGAEALESFFVSTIEAEAAALANFSMAIPQSLASVLSLLGDAVGKIVVSGVGKSGIIAHKVAATFAATGTPSTFLHAGEACHGDLGMIQGGDVVLLLSASGTTKEVLTVAEHCRRGAISSVALTRESSPLAELVDLVLPMPELEEADPNGLSPTVSTTLQLAIGDALASALTAKSQFGLDQFNALHPHGSLGYRTTQISQIMHSGDSMPLVYSHASMHETVIEMTSKRLGCTLVVDDDRHLAGIVTDGDLRRNIESLHSLRAGDLLTSSVKTATRETLVPVALALMERHRITALAIIDDQGTPVGVVHMHDILRLR